MEKKFSFKRFATLALLLASSFTTLMAQQKAADGTVIAAARTFTMVIPNYDRMAANDYSVMVRQKPSAKSAKVTEIYFVEGLSNAVLLADPTEKWVRVGGYKKQGFSNRKTAGMAGMDKETVIN